MTLKTDYMVPQNAPLDGQQVPVWVGREIFGHVFEDATTVAIDLSPLEYKNVQPKALRARLVYGAIDTKPLPGQQTRRGKLSLVMFVVGAMVLGLILWLKR